MHHLVHKVLFLAVMFSTSVYVSINVYCIYYEEETTKSKVDNRIYFECMVFNTQYFFS